jgi:MFS family permease
MMASALCSLAATPALLIASRVLQGVTAATLVPHVLAIIRVEFPGPERPLAIGLYGSSMGFASIVAQLLGGLLVTMDLFGWSRRLIFLANILIGLVAVVEASWMIRESRSPTRPTSHRTSGHIRVTALSYWEREAMSLTLAPVYANIIHGWSAALAALTVLRSRGR